MFSTITITDAENDAPALYITPSGIAKYRLYKDNIYTRSGESKEDIASTYTHALEVKEGLLTTVYTPVAGFDNLKKPTLDNTPFFLVWYCLGVEHCEVHSLNTIAYNANFENSVDSVDIEKIEELTDLGKSRTKNLTTVAPVIVDMLQEKFDKSIEEFNKQTSVLLNNNNPQELAILEEKSHNLEFVGERLAMFTKIVNAEKCTQQECLFEEEEKEED